ncbi:MAG: DNA polymerase ligase N-terminal domain-containing protein [Elainellaceae cyanobacterium]
MLIPISSCPNLHPSSRISKEGVIPEGEYGAGSVLVWDTGAYHNLKHEDESAESMAEAMEQAISNGHIEVWLEGKKIQGGYALTRIATGKSERWLLIKMKDEAADARRNPVSTEPNSVLSGRSLDEIA